MKRMKARILAGAWIYWAFREDGVKFAKQIDTPDHK